MAQKKNLNQESEAQTTSKPEDKFKGNEFVSADNQRTYAELMEEMKHRPELNKLMLAPDWSKIQAVLSFLILKQLEKR